MSESVSADTSGPSGWVSAAEAGQLCHVSERTVRRWVASGRLRADASGPTLRLAVADLQPYFAAAVDTLPDAGQPLRAPAGLPDAGKPPRAPAGHPTVLRPEPSGPALEVRLDGAADRPHAAAPGPDDTPDAATPRTDNPPHADVSRRDDTPHADISRPDNPPHADVARRDDTPRTHAQLVATLEASIADLRQRLDHAEQVQAELRRLLALALQERAFTDPKAEELHNHTTASPRPWWQRWLSWPR